ncbi:MAG: DEAD/DEAH box helicase [Bacilli bacterium]|nr:DEAD/DEAH box helicase [Bacilli bacterium]
MNNIYFELNSVKKILYLRNESLNNNILKDNVVEIINDFFNETLIFISFYGIDNIRIFLNVLINFIFDYYKSELKQCDYSLIFQFIKLLNYYPHLRKLGLTENNMDITDYLNIRIRDVNDMLLTDSQIEFYRNIMLKNQIIYSAPTSYGKTTICLNGFIDLLKIDKINNLLIIVPTKALINEYKKNINQYIKQNKYDINVVESAYSEFKKHQKTIYIFTQERVLAFFTTEEKKKNIDYILVDEAQIISYLKNKRTPLLLKAISLFERCPKIYLTPFVKNFNDNVIKKIDSIDSFNEIVVTGKESLVANNKFIIDLYNYDQIKVSDVTFQSPNDYLFFERTCPKVINDANFLNVIPIMKKVIDRQDKTIVFTSNLNNSLDWPELFQKEYNCSVKNMSKRMKALIKHLEENVHPDFDLINYLKSGIAYHNSYLDSFTKRQIEYIFTEEIGSIDYLFCTNTISQGVNFSAKNIFAFIGRIQSDNPDLDFVNLLGRAARLKYNGLGNLYFVKSTQTTKYEKVFMESNDNLNIELSSVSSDDIKKSDKIELRSYIADNSIENEEKNRIIRENQHLLNELNINIEPIDQMNYSINQSDIFSIEKSIESLSESTIKKYIKFYQSYESTIEFISFLKNTYNWEKIYLNGSNQKKKRILNVEFIATIITKLIQGNTINSIISYNIDNKKYDRLFINVETKSVSSEQKYGYDPCNLNNKKHLNIIIINSLFDVQNLIEFEVKKYIQDFYYRVNKMHNVTYKDENVENFIDFTTTEKKKINLMNIGIIDTFAINDIVKNKNYDEIISNDNIELNELFKKVSELEGDESPLYYAIKDIVS